MTVEINNESGVEVDEQRLVQLARFAMEQLRIHPQAELSILLVDEQTMADYHVRFMDLPGPTDVLSFPMDELRPPADDDSPASTSFTTGCSSPLSTRSHAVFAAS